MMVNVRFDLLLRNGSAGAAEIAACPQMLAPVAFLEQGKLVLQLARRDAFDELRDLRRTERGRCRHHQMAMIATDMPLQDRDFPTGADLPDQVARPLCRFAAQHLIAVLRDPYKVILNVVDRMRSLPLVGHCSCSPILPGMLLSFLAEAIRLTAKVLYPAHGK